MGARTNRQVALVTDDFRLYHELAPFFESQGVQLLGLRPGEPVPEAVRVLLDGPADDPRSTPTRGDIEATWLATLEHGERGPLRHVVIGVDPGDTIGLAVVADGHVYWTRQTHDVAQAVQRILAWRQGLAPAHWSLHVGDGAPEKGRALRRATRAAWPELDISVVCETRSTPTSPVTGSRHTDAAIHIAMRRP